jgi:hypothetical protein
VPVVYLGLWQMPAVIGPDPELKPFKTVHYVLTMTMAAPCGPRAGRDQAPFHRSRRHAETHAAAVTHTDTGAIHEHHQKLALVTLLGVAFAASAAALKTDPAKAPSPPPSSR